MVFFLRKYLFIIVLFCCNNILFATTQAVLPHKISFSGLLAISRKPDTAAHPIRKSIKICSCQILILQTNIRRQKNFALLAERTNNKSFNSDISYANRVIEKEKRHMKSYFYDKLEVVDSFSDAIDCRSMYKRLKNKNKTIFLYDILDADIRR
ncbi:MAG TPA: hypothetical protein VMT76_09570 [Puia sp.]|nr:hypothetical protein [Puia sp.]